MVVPEENAPDPPGAFFVAEPDLNRGTLSWSRVLYIVRRGTALQ
jgi:hypothetical protein